MNGLATSTPAGAPGGMAETLDSAPALLLLVARARLARGDWDEAEALLARVVGDRDRERAGTAWAWTAVARLGRGDTEGAREAALAALAIDREDPVARYALEILRRGDLSAGRGTPSRPGRE